VTFHADGLPARQAAYKVLNDIIFQRRSLDEAFARTTAIDALPARDRGFVRLLVSVVLKRTWQMDSVLQGFLHEPFSNLKPPQLLNIFRLGIAQYSFLGTPPHAAVDTTVELAAAEGIAHHKSLVNAIMRRLVREGLPPLDEVEAGRLNTPDWLWAQWAQDYGVEVAGEIAAANLTEAPVDFSVKGDPERWAQTLDAQVLPTGSLRRKSSGFIPDLPGFTQGLWWIQNAAAALPAKVLLSGLKLSEMPVAIVDLCAAPGGKTAQLAVTGARVIAIDRSADRLVKLHENMQRLHLDVEAVAADGAGWQPETQVDAVLVDAPCTATGTIRHQPDVLYLKDIRDQEKMAALQRRLLVNAVKMLKPGGVLVYCTCSLQKAEGEHQAEWLLTQGLPLIPFPIQPDEIPGIAEMVTARGEIRCLPSHWKDNGGIDGFYIARFSVVPERP
jgi:16S rRNA (cytosine967-C5)-methyltransferase